MTALEAKNTLWEIIQKEFQEYEKYFNILTNKKATILNDPNNLDLLNDIIKKEEKKISEVKKLEKDRNYILKKYASLSGKKEGSLRFSDIFTEDNKSEFLKKFKTIVTDAYYLNDEIKLLSNYMLKMNVTIIKGIYKSLKKLTYSRDKQSESKKKQSFNLVDLRA